ncbi:argininosuccinate synthase-like [Amyelois transitella]|uniref:argininosuccinate synthase-like n=1 Tax=Amyelois transitella TaxID=680683 RepID=UPI0029908276|nr:argininosuccinate synthase-like [Amyelois transitella]
MAKDLVILAYSGGLDTSCILKWLIQQNYDVVCYLADVGQNENFEKAKVKAKSIGAKDVIVEDLREEFISNYMFPAIQMGLVYESRYLLGTSLARPCISVGIVKAAKTLGAKYVYSFNIFLTIMCISYYYYKGESLYGCLLLFHAKTTEPITMKFGM